jgi:hypothetical protein
MYDNIESKIYIRDFTEETLVSVGTSVKMCPGNPLNEV